MKNFLQLKYLSYQFLKCINGKGDDDTLLCSGLCKVVPQTSLNLAKKKTYEYVMHLQELSFGADSNGSGVVMLLELARLFSHLYTNSKSHARYNIIFLLSGAGKLNYQGSKKWLEDQLDGLEGSLIQVCLNPIACYFSK